jgi:hypothetical protein
MGLFLNLSGVIGASSDEVSKVLAAYAAANAGEFALVQGTTDDQNIGVMAQQGSNTSVFHPSGLDHWFELSQELSLRLQKPVFSFHIHDEDFWLYYLFHKGQEVGHFNPVPEYWGIMSSEEKQIWAGDAQLISDLVPGVYPSSIEKYLVEWDVSKEVQEKAYPQDEYLIGDCWQMCDFMKKIGLPYPFGTDESPLGPTFRLVIPPSSLKDSHQRKSESPTKRPWWKFW